jgi:cyclopropane-fatty-acyl-phospholipid synthase
LQKFTKNLIDQSPYKDSMEVELVDYRKVKGQFDGVVSIEMFEAVGEQYWEKYFNTIARSLKPNGKALIQTITIDDDYFENYRKTNDFIKMYMFPGGMLPSCDKFKECAEKSKLMISDDHAFGQDYAKTLQEWLLRFDQAKKEVLSLGFNEEFINLWRFYLSYCIAGFTAKRTDVHQFTLENTH